MGRHLQVRKESFKMTDKVKIYKSSTTLYFPWLEKESIHILKIMFISNLTTWVMKTLCHNSCWLERTHMSLTEWPFNEKYFPRSLVSLIVEDVVNYFLIIMVLMFLWLTVSVILVNMKSCKYFYTSNLLSMTRERPQIFPHMHSAS